MNTSISTPVTSHNQTGAEMLHELGTLDQTLATEGLTPDAVGPLKEERDRLHDRFSNAASYALALSKKHGVVFDNPLANSTEEVVVADTVAQPETEKPLDFWTALTPEQKTHAEESIAKMAEKFKRPKSDFGLVEVTEKDQDGEEVTRIKAILTATEGIDLGDPTKEYDVNRSWDKTSAKNQKALKIFGIELNGKAVDTRQALTFETLKALAKANPEINEWVWLLNEQAGGSDAPLAVVRAGDARRYSGPRDAGFRGIAFRPAVAIN